MSMLPTKFEAAEIMTRFETALAITSDAQHQVLYRRALYRAHRLKQYEQAAADLEIAFRNCDGKKRKGAYKFAQGWVYLQLQDYSKAKDAYATAGKHVPDNEQIRQALVYITSTMDNSNGNSSAITVAPPARECRCYQRYRSD